MAQQQTHRWDVPFWVPTSVGSMRLGSSLHVQSGLIASSLLFLGDNFQYQHLQNIS